MTSDATSLRTHLCGRVGLEDVGRQIRVTGWVAHRREHGEHLAFVDLRDWSGILQCVVPGTVDVRSEYVVAVSGTVRRRPEGTINDKLPTGQVEVGDCEVEVLNVADPPPFAVDDRSTADEAHRLRYRFVDLRRPRMQENLRTRATVIAALRRSMEAQGFCEVETPLLWAPTPEGARASSPCRRGSTGATSTCCPRAPSWPSSCSWSGGSTGTSRSPAACATRIPAPTGSSSSPSSTWRPPLSHRRT